MRRSILVPVFALVVGLAGLQGSASAAVVRLERASAATAFTSANKSITVNCPAGKRLLGTSADIAGGDGEVGYSELIPNATLTGVTVRAVEDGNGFPATWQVGTSGLCAMPVPGLERIVATSPTNSTNKGATAVCPAGKRVLGTGASIGGGGGEVVLRDLIPNGGLTSVAVFGAEDESGFAGNWSVSAYAICANPVAGLQRIVAPSVSDSETNKQAVANCPAGKQVTGVGGALEGATGQVRMDDLLPFPALATSVQVAGHEDENGATPSWRVIAYAICANTAQWVQAFTSVSSSPGQTVSASCPADKMATGGGGGITFALGQAALTQFILPHVPFLESFQATGRVDATGTSSLWSITAYAICATPLPGLEVVVESSALDTVDAKSIVATCPTGKRVLGAGGAVLSSDVNRSAILTGVAPNPGLTNVTATGTQVPGIQSDWSVEAYAICANAPAGLQLVSATSDDEPAEVKVVGVSCPAGKNLLGTGAEIDDGFWLVALDEIRPNETLTRNNVTATATEDGVPPGWDASAFAICANP